MPKTVRGVQMELLPPAKSRRRSRRKIESLADVIVDLQDHMAQLSKFIDVELARKPSDSKQMARLFALHAQIASRLGRLLRDERALSGEAADGIAGAFATALDELGSEWGRDDL